MGIFSRKKEAEKQETEPPYFILMVLEVPGTFTLVHPTADYAGKFNAEINELGALNTTRGDYRPVGVLYRRIKPQRGRDGHENIDQ